MKNWFLFKKVSAILALLAAKPTSFKSAFYALLSG